MPGKRRGTEGARLHMETIRRGYTDLRRSSPRSTPEEDRMYTEREKKAALCIKCGQPALYRFYADGVDAGVCRKHRGLAALGNGRFRTPR
jgi:hypothetical protein